MASETHSATRFEERRPYLCSIAFRMLGSVADAEDAVQGTWLRLNRRAGAEVDNWDGWTVTVLTRICLDILRRRKSRAEENVDGEEELGSSHSKVPNPEQEAAMAEAVGVALLVVLNALAPAERIAFVMHDMFGLSFDEIATILEKTPTAVRQLASRARRRIQGTPPQSPRHGEDHKVVASFLSYLREGDINGVMSVLHPDVIRRADAAAVPPPGELLLSGKAKVAQEAVTNTARAKFAQPALIDGQVGIVVAPQGRLRVALLCKVLNECIVDFDVIAEPERLLALHVRLIATSN